VVAGRLSRRRHQAQGKGRASSRGTASIDEIPQQVLKNVTPIQVQHMDEVLKQALVLSDPDAFSQSKDAESAPLVS